MLRLKNLKSLLAFLLALPALAFGALDKTQLSEQSRNKLRYRLENLWNEVDLVVRNRKVNEADVRRQEREFKQFQVFDRIPSQPRYDDFREQLKKTLAAAGFQLHRLDWVRGGTTSPAPAIPEMVWTDSSFHFSSAQVAAELPFRAILTTSGKTGSTAPRIEGVFRTLERLTELEPGGPVTTGGDGHRWEVRGKVFRYRELRLPKLRPRDPLTLLPPPARRNPRQFAAQEPLLWDFVARIRERSPQAEPYYENRARFMLNDARMSFFLSKLPKG